MSQRLAIARLALAVAQELCTSQTITHDELRLTNARWEDGLPTLTLTYIRKHDYDEALRLLHPTHFDVNIEPENNTLYIKWAGGEIPT